MAASAVLLAIIDAVIISATPTTTRIVFALVVTIVVGYVILTIWRSNKKLEKKAAEVANGPGGGKPAGRSSSGKRLRAKDRENLHTFPSWRTI